MKTKLDYKCKKVMHDATNTPFQLFAEGQLAIVKGLRTNNPNIGIVLNKTFIKICTFEDLLFRLDKVKSFFNSTDIKLKAAKLFSGWV